MREQTYVTPEALWAELGNWGLLLAQCVECGTGWAEAEVCWDAIWARSAASLRAGLFLPLPYLLEVFGLEPFARKCLVLAVLPETDRRFEALYAGMTPGGQGALTADLALRLCDCAPTADCLRTLSPAGALLCYCMEERGFAGQSELSRILKPAQRILSFLLQGAWEEPGVPGLTLWQPEGEPSLPLTGQLQRYLAETPTGETAVFELWGQSGAGRRTLARDFAAGQNLPVLFVEGRYLTGESGVEFRRALLRETVLQQCAVCCGGLDSALEAAKTEPEAERFLTELLNDLAATTPICFLLSAEEWLPEVQGETWRVVPIPLPLPDLEESRALWAELFTRYPVAAGIDPDELAGKYRFTPGQMRRAMEEAAALTRWDGRQRIDDDTLDQGCRRQLRHALGEKAQKVETIFTWEDLILPDFSKKLLESACDQMKHRRQVYGAWGFSRKLAYGTGLSLLFSGPPGTGKTMAAQIVAGELKLELYKVDLASVVSKYVGETEKNLGAIFREAARGQTLLFFDEADVLFGKRTEVKDSHDKYSNMEAAYLLQKIEEYPGVSVLATNFLQNFDEAFRRRLKFIIDFPFPDVHYRLQLWRAVFPGDTPLAEDIDWDYLAGQFELSGSGIKNVALNAAFLAARDGCAVGMPQLLTALKRELYKNGKLLSREDFGEYYMLAE